MSTRVASPTFGWSLSLAGNPVAAAEEASEACMGRLRAHAGCEVRKPDLVFAFASGVYGEKLESVAARIRETIDPGCLVCVSAESIVGGRASLEKGSGLSMLAGAFPEGTRITPFSGSALDVAMQDEQDGVAKIREAVDITDELRATFLFADPFSMPLGRLIPLLNHARRPEAVGERMLGTLLGGVASAGKAAGENILVLNDEVKRSGAVGLSISGPVRVDTIVSQGCRAFGPQYVVTRARGNLIQRLGGQAALDATREAVQDLSLDERSLLGNGLLLGQATSEYKDRLGRGDFIIRQIIGADEESGSVAVGDMIRAGRTVRFHLRDAISASEDLALLLDGQKIHGPPSGALLITCNGRGSKLFGKPNHDSEAFQRAFDRAQAGEELAKVGDAIDPNETPSVPMAGFFASGEIGPVGGESFLHGHTACFALFRAAEGQDGHRPD